MKRFLGKIGRGFKAVLTFPVKEVKTAVKVVKIEQQAGAILDDLKEARKPSGFRWRSKTLWFHILTLVLSFLGYIPIDPKTVIMLQAVIGILLRFLTDKPLYTQIP